ncbi:MAG: hypothetical protein SV429_06155 [Pseudomonadota bacterium]|nr:hypothetical protein [Pseudomonadota bacterium]
MTFSVVWSGFVLAEPYAEWGVIGKDMPLQEINPDMKVPDASEVPIPPPPGAKFIVGGGDNYCAMGLRTKRSVEEVCAYYRSKLKGYEQVDAPTMNSKGICKIYKDGDMGSNLGVRVEKEEDPMFVENGSTLVVITYPNEGRGDCSR